MLPVVPERALDRIDVSAFSPTFLYNTGPVLSLSSHHWNRRQFYTITRIEVTEFRLA